MSTKPSPIPVSHVNVPLAPCSNAKEAIKKMWKIFAVGGESIFELRGLWPKGIPGAKPPRTRHFRGTAYPDAEELRADVEAVALDWNAIGFNVYAVMNPLKQDWPEGRSATDAAVRYRDLLLIDIDRVGDTTAPSTVGELEAARALAIEIREYLTAQGWPEPVVVMSGNGFHLYYVLAALANDAETDGLVKAALASLSSAFDTENVGVDRAVFNASRITKVPGTIMRKGLQTTDRPYRMAVVCDVE